MARVRSQQPPPHAPSPGEFLLCLRLELVWNTKEDLTSGSVETPIQPFEDFPFHSGKGWNPIPEITGKQWRLMDWRGDTAAPVASPPSFVEKKPKCGQVSVCHVHAVASRTRKGH